MNGLKRIWLLCLCSAMVAACGDDDGRSDSGTDVTDDGAGDVTLDTADDCESIPEDLRCDEESAMCDGDNLIRCVENEDECLVLRTTECDGVEDGFCNSDNNACAVAVCEDECTEGRTCDGDDLVICAVGPEGCLEETTTECDSTCNDSGETAICEGTCEDECSTEGRSCNGDDLVVCAMNADGCLEETTTECDADGGMCDDSGSMAMCESADLCPEAAANPVLTCATGTISGTTAGGTNVFDEYTCNTFDYDSAEERAYVFEATDSVTVTVSVVRDAASTADMDLFALSGDAACNVGAACLDGSAGSGDTEEVVFDLLAGESAYVVYDSYDSGESTGFDLTVDCEVHTCGDGTVSGPETCDDSNATAGDGCSATCEIEAGYVCETAGDACVFTCGDGVLDANNECDDGNTTSGDGCSDVCEIEAGYVCDTPGDSCEISCGNGVIDGEDECDDSNMTAGDGCSASCEIEAGYLCETPGELCEQACGNGEFDAGELCDDGNTVAGDGCSATCESEMDYLCTDEASVCQTGVLAWFSGELEDTDPMWPRPTDSCGEDTDLLPYDTYMFENTTGAELTVDIVATFADGLDGFLHVFSNAIDATSPATAVMGCEAGDDDESFGSAAGIRASRIASYAIAAGDTIYLAVSPFAGGRGAYTLSVLPLECGDGFVAGDDECDDGNTAAGDGCSDLCELEDGYVCEPGMLCTLSCGDGLINSSDECDDSNTTAGDGCSAMCEVEANFSCTGEPSTCFECGDGNVDGDEVCDDGNTVDGDSCAADCSGITVSGSLEASDMQWDRPSTSCAGGSDPDHYYDTYSFVAPVTGTYTATVSWDGVDGFLHAFSDPFDGSTTNCITGGDDFGGTGGSQVTFSATAGSTYVLVMSTYDPNDTGDWDLTIE